MRLFPFLSFVCFIVLSGCYATYNKDVKTNVVDDPTSARFLKTLQTNYSVTQAPNCKQPTMILSFSNNNQYEVTQTYQLHDEKRRKPTVTKMKNGASTIGFLGLIVAGSIFLSDEIEPEDKEYVPHIAGGSVVLLLTGLFARKTTKITNKRKEEARNAINKTERIQNGTVSVSYHGGLGGKKERVYNINSYGKVTVDIRDLGIDLSSYQSARYTLKINYEGQPMTSYTIQGPIDPEAYASCVMRAMSDRMNFQSVPGIERTIYNQLAYACTTSSSEMETTTKNTVYALLKKYGFKTNEANVYTAEVMRQVNCY